MAQQSFFLKVAEIKNQKILLNNNLSLPLSSGIEIFLECTIIEFGFFWLWELPYILYEKQEMLQNEY